VSEVECQRAPVGWTERVRARLPFTTASGPWRTAGFCLLAQGWFAWHERTQRPRPRFTDHGLTFAPMPAWAAEPCGGSSDLADAFGLVGGPGAVGLPTPVDDLRTETRAVGW